jgi:hypothetical protein
MNACTRTTRKHTLEVSRSGRACLEIHEMLLLKYVGPATLVAREADHQDMDIALGSLLIRSGMCLHSLAAWCCWRNSCAH